jgi:2-polyprenyl-3-methyl-5-hydroxy-6-metoxy-1,4-benzoquinol methylase
MNEKPAKPEGGRAPIRGSVAHSYSRRPDAPGYWQYDGLPVQAEVEVHQYAVAHSIRHFPLGTRVLDVAAGHGALSKAMQDAGFAVSCTSWDGNVALPIPTYRVDLDHPFSTAEVGGERYPIVCGIDIIEHLENPTGFLRSCRAVVSDGGHVLLSTPNVESSPARLQWLIRGCPLVFDRQEVRTNRHISMQWRNGLEAIIEAAGLAIVERQFLGVPRLRGPLAPVKRLVYWGMRQVLAGDLDGESRVYVLTRASTPSLNLGAGEVY